MVGKEHNTAPDLINPVLGYKVLEINKLGVITSPYQRSVHWQTPNQTAKCIRHLPTQMFIPVPKDHAHDSPDPECQCGLYSYYELEGVQSAPIYKGSPVLCVVSCTGAIEAHKTGMRAQHMQIRAVAIAVDKRRPRAPNEDVNVKECGPLLKRRAKAWKVPYVLDYEQLPLIAAELGLETMPESLRPE